MAGITYTGQIVVGLYPVTFSGTFVNVQNLSSAYRTKGGPVDEPESISGISKTGAFLLEMAESSHEGSGCQHTVHTHVYSMNICRVIKHTLEMAVFQCHNALAVNKMSSIGRGCDHAVRTFAGDGGETGDRDVL